MTLLNDIRFCLKPRCPVCRERALFKPWSVTVRERCDCGEKLEDHDIGDGAVVFLIFLLGFTIPPLAWWMDLIFAWPLFQHVIVWGVVTLALILLILPATKAYIILLEYRHLKK